MKLKHIALIGSLFPILFSLVLFFGEMCIRDRDIQHIIKDILKLNINYMLHEDYGHYSYTEHYSLGDIFIYTSADEEKGVLLELKGRGCRQFESYLLAQQRRDVYKRQR